MLLSYLKFTALQKEISAKEDSEQIQSEVLPFPRSPNLSYSPSAFPSSTTSSFSSWHHRWRTRSETCYSPGHPATPTLWPYWTVSRPRTADRTSLWTPFAEARREPNTRHQERLHLKTPSRYFYMTQSTQASKNVTNIKNRQTLGLPYILQRLANVLSTPYSAFQNELNILQKDLCAERLAERNHDFFHNRLETKKMEEGDRWLTYQIPFLLFYLCDYETNLIFIVDYWIK